MKTNNDNLQHSSISLAAIDPYSDTHVVAPTERLLTGKDMVEWGDGNLYPDYLLDLYSNVPTLASIINGNVDFVTGDDSFIVPLAGLPDGMMNRRGDTIREQLRDIAKDAGIYGGYALQVIRDLAGHPAEIYYIDIRFLRTNKDRTVFYYCEDWTSMHKDTIVYPAFQPNLDWDSLDDDARQRNASSILFVTNIHTQVYPSPLYAPAVKACEIERCITDFHLNSINNGFVSSLIVNFNGGVPEDKVKEEIEDTFAEKFTGHQNGGRVMFSWNRDKDSATEIVEPKIEDFGEKYQALATHSRQQIFNAFRAIPLLFGLTSEANTGFSTDEFEQSFKLYNRTQIRPVQNLIADTYAKIYGQDKVLTIVPFSLSGTTEKTVA